MTGISIDCDIPIPPPTQRGTQPKYPWRGMKVGDSFKWPGVTLKQATDACRHRRRRHGELYRVAKVTEDGKHMIRIWRVA